MTCPWLLSRPIPSACWDSTSQRCFNASYTVWNLQGNCLGKEEVCCESKWIDLSATFPCIACEWREDVFVLRSCVRWHLNLASYHEMELTFQCTPCLVRWIYFNLNRQKVLFFVRFLLHDYSLIQIIIIIFSTSTLLGLNVLHSRVTSVTFCQVKCLWHL